MWATSWGLLRRLRWCWGAPRWVTPWADSLQTWNLWRWRRGLMCDRVCSMPMDALGSIEIPSRSWVAGFGAWVGMPWTSGQDFPICIGSSMGVGDTNDWFCCRACAWPSSGYTNATVQFSSSNAWPSWSTIDSLTLEEALIKYTLRSILILTFLSHPL